MPDAVVKTTFIVDLAPWIDGLKTMLSTAATTGEQIQPLLNLQIKQPDFSGLESQLAGITNRTTQYVQEQSNLVPAVNASSAGQKEFGDTTEAAGTKVEAHTLKMRGLRRESRESFQAIAFLAISISSMAATAGEGDTKLGKMAQTMGQGVSAGFGLASMLVALEIASGPVAIIIGVIATIGIALAKILSADEENANALKAAMDGFSGTLKGASLSSLEEYRANLQKLRGSEDDHIKTLNEQAKALSIWTVSGPQSTEVIKNLKESIKDATKANEVFAASITQVDAEILAKKKTYAENARLVQDAEIAAIANKYDRERALANQAMEDDINNGFSQEAAGKKHSLRLEEIAAEESAVLLENKIKDYAVSEKIDEDRFELELDRVRRGGTQMGIAQDEVDVTILELRKKHIAGQLQMLTAFEAAGVQLTREQYQKQADLAVQYNDLDAQAAEARVKIANREADEKAKMFNTGLETEIGKLRANEQARGVFEKQITLDVLQETRKRLQARLDELQATINPTRAEYEEAERLQLALTQNAGEQTAARITITQSETEAIQSALQAGMKATGEATAAHKMLAIADATMSTYEAAAKALASAPPPFNFILAAAVTAAGLADVSQILGTTTGFDVGGKVKSPTLALLGERGKNEIIAPERDFIQVFREDLMPQILKPMPQGASGASVTSSANNAEIVAGLKAINDGLGSQQLVAQIQDRQLLLFLNRGKRNDKPYTF